MSCYISSVGAALPDRIVTNAEIAKLLEVEPSWIEANSGIKERRWIEANQATSDLAVGAVRSSLENIGITADQIDYLHSFAGLSNAGCLADCPEETVGLPDDSFC